MNPSSDPRALAHQHAQGPHADHHPPHGAHGGHGGHSQRMHGGHHHHGAHGGQSHGTGPNPNFAQDNSRLLMSIPRTVNGLRCMDVLREMEEQLLLLSGGRDRRGGAILTFPQSPRRERAKPEDYKRLLEYLLAVPW